ncbi:hypothetical protein HJFPF1_10401 [Paramyrothecium foliicola]|nr:hypothetical protein HJFPF1_10401 [Paramyrothecium foliicola]
MSITCDIPSSFLTGPPERPISIRPVDFANSAIPEYKSYKALILDNVLSKDECQQLLRLAESSVPLTQDGRDASPWRPALVNYGAGYEMANPNYRNSDRIIWDEQVIVDRLWERCAQADGLKDLLSRVPHEALRRGGRWEYSRWNERMRFLKYTKGQFFRPHTDGAFWYEDETGKFETHYTVQLYLNDSASEASGKGHDATCVGGATSFISRDRTRKVDVNPKTGSVLLFQHARLFHEGAEVKDGTKYAMRTDILYKFIPE